MYFFLIKNFFLFKTAIGVSGHFGQIVSTANLTAAMVKSSGREPVQVQLRIVVEKHARVAQPKQLRAIVTVQEARGCTKI